MIQPNATSVPRTGIALIHESIPWNWTMAALTPSIMDTAFPGTR